MTPVALHAARSRSADEPAFLYGTVLMSNSASLVLIGSNLTNLLVFARHPVPGFVFARHMIAPWLIAVVATILLVGLWRRSSLRTHRHEASSESPDFRWGPGVVAVVVALVLMLALSHPGLPVFALGVVVEIYSWRAVRSRGPRETVRTANPTLVVPLFVLAVLVGWLGRTWTWPSHLVAHASSLATAAVAGLSSIVDQQPARRVALRGTPGGPSLRPPARPRPRTESVHDRRDVNAVVVPYRQGERCRASKPRLPQSGRAAGGRHHRPRLFGRVSSTFVSNAQGTRLATNIELDDVALPHRGRKPRPVAERHR